MHAEVGKSKNRCFCWFLAALFVPRNGVNGRFKITTVHLAGHVER